MFPLASLRIQPILPVVLSCLILANGLVGFAAAPKKVTKAKPKPAAVQTTACQTMGHTLKIAEQAGAVNKFYYQFAEPRGRSCTLEGSKNKQGLAWDDSVWKTTPTGVQITYPGVPAPATVQFQKTATGQRMTVNDPDGQLSQFYCGMGLSIPKVIELDRTTKTCQLSN